MFLFIFINYLLILIFLPSFKFNSFFKALKRFFYSTREQKLKIYIFNFLFISLNLSLYDISRFLILVPIGNRQTARIFFNKIIFIKSFIKRMIHISIFNIIE